tara:strand:+ start:5421 stop:5867 length:447 start_codon:yes stop_codon:yes gene_type:complete
MKIKVIGEKPKTFIDIKDVKSKKKVFLVKITKKMHFDFIKLSGDNSPIHTNKKFAVKNGFKKPMCHGFLISIILSNIYGKKFPGGSELCVSQTSFFRSPFYIGDTLRIELMSIKKNIKLKLLELEVKIFIKKKLIFNGEAKFVLALDN